MDLTWVAAGSVLLLGTGYAFVRRAGRFRVVCWSLLCAALFALATRDLFRPRERSTGRTREGRAGQVRDRASTRKHGRTTARKRERASARRSDRSAGDTTSPLVARLRRRFARWLD